MMTDRSTALNRITRIGVKQYKAVMIVPMMPVLSACLEPVELGWVGVENFFD